MLKGGAEDFTSDELEDELRERIFEYDNHMRLAIVRGGAGVFEFLITGAAEFAEDVAATEVVARDLAHQEAKEKLVQAVNAREEVANSSDMSVSEQLAKKWTRD